MSDRDLRALERAAASGDAEAEARLLVGRLRAGELPEGWLEAAARLGHEPARRALGRRVPFLIQDRVDELRLELGETLFGLLCKACWRVKVRDDPSVRLAPPPLDRFQSAGPRLTEEEWRAVRIAVTPLVLRPPSGPPPVWPTDDPCGASDARTAAFDAASAAPTTEEAAAKLRRRVREGRLDPLLLELAADLGDPAAWLAVRRDRRPSLDPPTSPTLLAQRVLGLVCSLLDRELAERKTGWSFVPGWAEGFVATSLGALWACGVRPDPQQRRDAQGDWQLDDGRGPEPPAAFGEVLRLAGGGSTPLPDVWERLRADLAAWALDGVIRGSPALDPVDPARPYTPKERYYVGDVVSHPKFGEGTVTRAAKDKVDVAFTDGPRTLAHGRP